MPQEDKTANTAAEGNNANNAPSQVTDGADQAVTGLNAKMGPDANNTLANNPNQTETPGMQANPAEKKPPTSEELVDAELGVGRGAIDQEGQQENQEADPATLQEPATEQKTSGTTPSGEAYGGNFGNSTQNSYADQDRTENQLGSAARGEFGSQAPGNTQGGYGNQYRETDVEGASNQGNERYYSGSTYNEGPQHNSYRDFDGREAPQPTAGTTQLQQQPGAATQGGTDDQPAARERDAQGQRYQNDNGSGYGPDSGYSDDYGQSSLPGNQQPNAEAGQSEQRNQSDKPNSTRGDYDPEPGQENPGQRRSQEQTYGHGAQQDQQESGTYDAPSARDEQQGDERRSGYRNGSEGSASKGFGSEGGSYNDEYDSADRNSQAGSPARGDYDQADKAQNYGKESRDEFRPDGQDNVDYGSAPTRNQGRDDDKA